MKDKIIWIFFNRDHDDDDSVFDAVGKLNEVKGMRGLCRYFKEVAQSARSGEQVHKNISHYMGLYFTILTTNKSDTMSELHIVLLGWLPWECNNPCSSDSFFWSRDVDQTRR